MQLSQSLSDQLSQVHPLDAQETDEISQAFRWLKDNPPKKHFVVYNVVINDPCKDFLLVHHRATGLWLPCGGHIEPNETPLNAALRELREELGIEAAPVNGRAFFVSISPGEESSQHACLWFLFPVCSYPAITLNRDELIAANWFSREALPVGDSDPHLTRFLQKFDAQCGNLRDTN